MDGYKLEITTTFFVIDTKTGVLLVNEGTTGKLLGESLGTMVVCQA